jgi:hypothetical protein
MAFTYVDYVSAQPLPASKAWAASFSWLNLILVSSSELRVTNLDGSVTVFSGSDFALDEFGIPAAGTVIRVERYDAGRSVLWESIDFRYVQAAGDPPVQG